MISNKEGHKFIIKLQDKKEKSLHLSDIDFWTIYAGRKVAAIKELAVEIDPEDATLPGRIFRIVIKEVNRRVIEHQQGELKHLSKVNDRVWQNYLEESELPKSSKQKGNTYVKEQKESI